MTISPNMPDVIILLVALSTGFIVIQVTLDVRIPLLARHSIVTFPSAAKCAPKDALRT